MESWGRSREVEKPKTPRKVATIEVWDNPPGLHTKPGAYRGAIRAATGFG